MLSYLRYLLLLTAGILSLTPARGQPGSGGTDTLCVSAPTGNYRVQGLSGSTFTWDTEHNGVITGQGNDSIQVTWNAVAGTYRLSVTETSADGCSGIPQVISIVLVEPAITLTGSPVCSADMLSYSLEVQVNGGIVTSTEGSVSTAGGTSWSVSGIPSGTGVQLTLAYNGCTATLNVDAPDCSCPSVAAPVSSGDRSYCSGDSIPALSASVAEGFTIDWYSLPAGGLLLAADTSSYAPGSAGIYYAEARDTSTDCVSSARTPVTLTEVPRIVPSIRGDSIICENEPVILQASGGSSYLWDSGDTTATVEISPVESGYAYVVETAGSCSDTAFHYIRVNPAPVLTTSDDTTIVQGTEAHLSASGAATYVWNPVTDLSCTGCADPVAKPFQTTTYCVTGTSDAGCSHTACVQVNVEIICDELFVPNVFAPGNGGHSANECFRVYGIDCVTELNLRIYNRWGELVFSTIEPQDCWDGTFRGKELNSGVFVYKADVVLLNGTKVNKTGNINLIR